MGGVYHAAAFHVEDSHAGRSEIEPGPRCEGGSRSAYGSGSARPGTGAKGHRGGRFGGGSTVEVELAAAGGRYGAELEIPAGVEAGTGATEFDPPIQGKRTGTGQAAAIADEHGARADVALPADGERAATDDCGTLVGVGRGQGERPFPRFCNCGTPGKHRAKDAVEGGVESVGIDGQPLVEVIPPGAGVSDDEIYAGREVRPDDLEGTAGDVYIVSAERRIYAGGFNGAAIVDVKGTRAGLD